MGDADLAAGDGLALHGTRDGLRVAWGDAADWLGPLGFALGAERWDAPESATRFEGEDDLGRHCGLALRWRGMSRALATSARAYADLPLLVLRIEALDDLDGLASGGFDDPGVAWRFRPPERSAPLPADAVAYGHQYSEFALPSFSDPSFARFFLLPQRPAVVTPLLLRAGARCLLLAPLDSFHEQVIAVPRNAQAAQQELRCGWHGDLESAPRGFASELALWCGDGVRALLEQWGARLQRRAGARARSRYADAALGRLSYWTDNGAAYWYRTEPGHDVPGTLAAVRDGLRDAQIPAHAFELDSWFYPHEVTRAFDAPEVVVPPTGMLTWEPRADALPDGVAALRERLGDAPLILHSRHFSSRSPYFEREPAWRDGDRAHPAEPDAFFDRLYAQAEAWGAIQVEQDWLVECFLGVRGLRAQPGRARAWQGALDRAAAEHGLSLLWCMATPADLCAATALPRVAAVRTSGDYRYVLGSASLWCWFLYGNALARALGLLPFKDVFLSCRSGVGRDGDPHAEVEALLAALSAGPVGIGDRVGRSDREIALRTCREDGLLVKPDLPLAPLERCFRGHAHLEALPLVGETWSDHPAGRWTYLVAIHASRSEQRLEFDVRMDELADAAPRGDCIAYDWTGGRCERVAPDAAMRFALAQHAWSLRVLCPLLPGELTLIGDPSKYACAGDRRVARIRQVEGGVACDVLGAPGEQVRVRGWCGRGRPAAHARHETASPSRPLALEAFGDGRFDVLVPIGARGASELRVEAGAAGR